MNGVPTTFWGKLQKDDSGAAIFWHPLVDHCADVAAVADALLSLPLWRSRIARVAGLREIDESIHARLCVFAALHDFGKFNISFQAKGRPDLDVPMGGHVAEAVAALRSNDQQIFDCFAELDFGAGALGLLLSAVAHHGRPRVDGVHQRTRWMPRRDLDPLAGLRELVKKSREWFPVAFETGTPLGDSPALQHAFAGLVMLADWLGSSTQFFPYSNGEPNRMAFARRQATELLTYMGIDVPLAMRDDERGCFERIAEFPPNAAQRALLSLPDAARGSITVLESETGSGKTEAAIAHFIALFERGRVDGLYFALPTRTAATQMFERVRCAIARAFSQNAPPVVLAVPGYLRVDDAEGQKLPRFEVLWPDSGRFRYRAWAAEAPKRYLAGAVVVGTVDQVLLSSLMVGHAHLRAVSLLRHLLVVDEVHASDHYMTRTLEDVLARHATAGGHALLLSATLGAESRGRLINADCEIAPMVTREAASGAAYPLVSHRRLPETGVQTGDTAHEGRAREVLVESTAILETPHEIGRRAFEAARAGAKVLVVRNTVADCIAVQQAIEAVAGANESFLFACRGVVAPHHARFARVDRCALDEALEERIGKIRPDGGCVVVATQTVQQSLDVDVDFLFTDLCPIDVLLQRIGRLHRHCRTRPRGFEIPRAVVAVPFNRDLSTLIRKDGSGRHHHGLGSIYSDLRVIEATWRLIERASIWRIPQMNRVLVEAGVHSAALAEIAQELGQRFEAHERYLIGTLLGHRRQAQLNLVDWTKPYCDMSFPSALDERIKTRLGEDDRRLEFHPALPGPFGATISELLLRAYLVKGVSGTAVPEDVDATKGTIRFRFGEKRFLYDRLGLRAEIDGAELGGKQEELDDGP